MDASRGNGRAAGPDIGVRSFSTTIICFFTVGGNTTAGSQWAAGISMGPAYSNDICAGSVDIDPVCLSVGVEWWVGRLCKTFAVAW